MLENKNGEKIEQGLNIVKKANQHDPSVTVAEHEKLLFSVFSILQKLGADDRPEVISIYLDSHICLLETYRIYSSLKLIK